jgi:hypothetical protein
VREECRYKLMTITVAAMHEIDDEFLDHEDQPTRRP